MFAGAQAGRDRFFQIEVQTHPAAIQHTGSGSQLVSVVIARTHVSGKSWRQICQLHSAESHIPCLRLRIFTLKQNGIDKKLAKNNVRS